MADKAPPTSVTDRQKTAPPDRTQERTEQKQVDPTDAAAQSSLLSGTTRPSAGRRPLFRV
jgi:hypothetical protein